MAQSQHSYIRKRDGRVVPFDRDKLARSITSAATVCGSGDSFYSAEIAEAVALHLDRAGPGVPTSDDIARAVERILSDTHHEQIAHAYRDFRLQREQSRARCTVLKPVQQSLLGAEETLQVMFNQQQRTRGWDRSLIVNDLISEARVPRPVAEDIARVVEERILASELRHVTTTLIRAVTDNELLARGYTGALRQRSSVTLSFNDLERFLDDDDPSALALEIGRRAVRPYVLDHVYSEDVAMAHRRGMIHLSGLEHPFAWYAQHISLADEHAEMHALRAALRRAILRVDAGQVTRIAIHLPRATDATFADWVHELCGYTTGMHSPAGVDIVVHADDAGALAAVLHDRPASAALRMVLHSDTGDVPALIAALHRLTAQGWQAGWAPAHTLASMAQRITLNIPQAVYRARSRDIDGVIEELHRTVDIAVQAHRQYCLFGHEYNRFATTAHAGCGIDLCGLHEALAVLTGSGMFDGSDGSACLRLVLSVLHEDIANAAEAQDLSIALLAGAPDVCGKRLAIIDQALFPELFGFLPLQPENLMSVIPAYHPAALTLGNDTTLDAARTAVDSFRRCFDAGLVPLHALDTPPDIIDGVMHSMLEAHCGFCLAPVRSAAEEQIASDDQMGLPGITPEE
jgi:transcriptional regulator NrdR family protein